MKSSVEVLEDNRVKVYVEVDEAEFDNDIDKAFKAIAKEVRLPGFRAGKVPRKVLEARIGLGAARDEALREAVPQYLTQAVREHDVDLIATPEVEITDGQEAGPVEFEAVCQVRPTIELTGYADLAIELPAVEVGDEDLEDAHAAELARDATLSDVDRPIQTGDALTIDLAATRDGEEVLGLNTEDWSYEVGQGWVTDDFDEQLVGASVGDTLEFTSTPKGTEEAAEFVVTITAAQERALPELTDEWVDENMGEFATVEEWNTSLRESLRERKLVVARQEAGTKINDALAELVTIELPEPLVAAELNQRMQQMFGQLQQQGIDVEQWLQATGQDPEQMVESMRPAAEQGVKLDLALRAIAVSESLDATDDDVEGEYARLAMQYGQKAKDIRRAYEQNDMVGELLTQIKKSKAYDFVVNASSYVDEAVNAMDRDELIGRVDDETDDDLTDDDLTDDGTTDGDTTDDETDDTSDNPDVDAASADDNGEDED
ncbi:MAG: trigger factor [Actinomycetota bacterium]